MTQGFVQGSPVLISGIDENNNSILNAKFIGFEVFPNPFVSDIKLNIIEFNMNEIYSITVFDALGKIVFKVSSISKNQTLPLDDLKTGMYFLRVQSSDNLLGSIKINKI